mmetsp:Transcript_39182/g.91281  ORF Transcript_39182/g.91281 Transcript_39182/m.91281 type:complete len:217 (+) Transcript_39182:899-1549(+)
MSSLCLVLGLGGSKGQVRMHILAFSTRLGICGWEKSLSMTMPLTSSVSSREPPAFPSIRIMSKLTSLRSRSATPRTACTAISAIFRLFSLIILELSVVMAVVTSGSGSSLVNPTTSPMASRCLAAISHARSYPSAMRTGWMPLSISRVVLAARKSERRATPGRLRRPVKTRWGGNIHRGVFQMAARRLVWRLGRRWVGGATQSTANDDESPPRRTG